MKQAYCEVKGRQILPAHRMCCPLPSAAIVHKTLNEQWNLTSRAGLTIALNQPELPEMPQCRKLRPTRRFIPRFTIRCVMRVRPRLTPAPPPFESLLERPKRLYRHYCGQSGNAEFHLERSRQ